jgi:hypothetical protein
MSHQEIVKRLLDSKTVDFAAVGKFVTEAGASFAVADEPWEVICGTGRNYIRLYRLSGPGVPGGNPVEGGALGAELNG